MGTAPRGTARSTTRAAMVLASLALLAVTPACKDAKSPSCRDDVGDDVEVAGRTGVEGVKTGGKTAVEGVKTFGSAAGGLLSGGKQEAKERWNEGKRETKATAEDGAASTKAQKRPRCR